jgi:hypothetical protein
MGEIFRKQRFRDQKAVESGGGADGYNESARGGCGGSEALAYCA